MTAEQVNAMTIALKKALIECLGRELPHHLGYPPALVNQRNSTGAKMVHTEDGTLRIDVLRDHGAASSRCSSASTSRASPASTTAGGHVRAT